MCGVAGIFGGAWFRAQLAAMVASQRHRGPDARGLRIDHEASAGLGHNRLSIIDPSEAGRQPMASADGRYWISYNGEIYNYVELRQALAAYSFHSQTDTEVLLAAFQRWGAGCLDRLIGMFAFLVWDTRDRRLFAARDRFGVKPLYYHIADNGSILLASEIKALAAAGVALVPDEVTWASYLVHGVLDHSTRTFWRGIQSLPPGHYLEWHDAQVRIRSWYDLPERVGSELDCRSDEVVQEELWSLLRESVRLRFRADVPVGINLSGGLDSSLLLKAVRAARGGDDQVLAFTFTTGDAAYDELPFVQRALAHSPHPLVVCQLSPDRVPALADAVQDAQDEPYSGLPTLAYAGVFGEARARGVPVLLDANGLDEQWAGYDYYAAAADGGAPGIVQGATDSPVRPDVLRPDFRALAELPTFARPFPDLLRNAQYRDLRHTKLPRALRFNDRISMRASVELREPFLDHRLVELALRQPEERRWGAGQGKRLVRRLAARLIGGNGAWSPKRPVQTPQREWLRGPLREWAEERVQGALRVLGGVWFDPPAVERAVREFLAGETSTSYFVWQWINAGMLLANPRHPTRVPLAERPRSVEETAA
jgi:asparagine synthase (glutamine-hydrolysing)